MSGNWFSPRRAAAANESPHRYFWDCPKCHRENVSDSSFKPGVRVTCEHCKAWFDVQAKGKGK